MTIPEYKCNEGPNTDVFNDCLKPTDVFLKFIEPQLENLVYQSNLHAVQRDRNLNFKKEELLDSIGTNLLMGYHVLPSWRHYWSGSSDLGVPLVSNTISRQIFDNILSNLHINDNPKIPVSNKDKLYKLKPMIDSLNETFRAFSKATRHLTIDESMITFKGRSSIKQYNPMKPIKRGYEIWCCADQKGYILHFDIYQGKEEGNDNEPELTDWVLGEKVVLKL
nr:piggyBac transposable element-derived protein 3-like [Leptinotarsa decemlineata]